MTEAKLDAIEARQIRMENDIRVINDLLTLFIERGAAQADARFPGDQQKFIGLATQLVRSPARA